jgi:hypothetical protein
MVIAASGIAFGTQEALGIRADAKATALLALTAGALFYAAFKIQVDKAEHRRQKRW